MYAYPGFVTDALIETMASIPQVCHYLDIPLQHGSPDVLKRMKRPHNMQMVRETIERLRVAMPDIAIRTTFLLGFPGETKAEFEELLDFVRETRFDRVGAFTFSPQPGTPAASMPGQLGDKVKQRRQRRLMSVQEKIAAGVNEAYIGREFPLLVESMEGQVTEDGAPIFVGRSYRDAPEVDGLVFCYGVARPGSMPIVRITGSMGHDLLAEPAGSEVIPLIVR
jgi:ribosomal protein S12 methylthiotransferase